MQGVSSILQRAEAIKTITHLYDFGLLEPTNLVFALIHNSKGLGEWHKLELYYVTLSKCEVHLLLLTGYLPDVFVFVFVPFFLLDLAQTIYHEVN